MFNKFQLMIYIGGLSKKTSKMVNIILIMGKYYMHKNKWENGKPNAVFFNKLKNILKGIMRRKISETMKLQFCFLLILLKCYFLCSCLFYFHFVQHTC